MKILDLPCDLCAEHLLCFFNEYHLLQMRFISKAFAEWVWYYFLNNKSTYYIHIGVGNHRIGKIVDNLLINMKRLKVIDLFTFDAVDFLSLTDVGLCELGRLSVEELRLKCATCISGSFIVEWILNASPLLESLKVLTLTNLKCEYLHLLKEFKNLQTLELLHIASERTLNQEEMDQTIIQFPPSLTEFRSNYPITRKNIEDITRQCPNLTILVIKPISFDDATMSLTLERVSEKIEEFSIFGRHEHNNLPADITGSYFSVFSSNTFTHLKSLKVIWKVTSDEVIQKKLSLLSKTLEKLEVVFVDYCYPYEMDTFLGCLCKLPKLTALTLDFPIDFQFKIVKDETIEQLKSTLQLKTLEIYGCARIDIVTTLAGQHLEKLTYHTDRYIVYEGDSLFFNHCENLKILDVKCQQSQEDIISYNIQSIQNCKLEEVLGMSIVASVIPYLSRSSLKVLHIILTKETVGCLKHLSEFNSLTKMKLYFDDNVMDFHECTLPANISHLAFEGDINGTEPGFTELLHSTKYLKELAFSKCKIKDDFVKNIVSLSDDLDVLKIEYNEGLTQESTEYFRKFTNCRVLLLECFDPRVLSSKYSLFEQEVSRATVIMGENSSAEKNLIYPTINYSDTEQALSYIRERISAREMKDACLAIDRITQFTTSITEEICKLFLVTYQYETEVETFSMLVDMDRLWHDGKISFGDNDLHNLEKIITQITSQSTFCVIANILMDCGRFTMFFNAFEYLIQNLDDINYEIQACTQEMISRVLHHFIDGKKDISDFSGHVITNTVTGIVENFAGNNSILDFINIVMEDKFFNSSKKTLALVAKQKAALLSEDYSETELEPRAIGEDVFTFVKENLPPQKRDYSIHLADIKVPKTGPFNTSYYSEPFTEFGHQWVVEFLPDDEDETLGNCTIFLTMKTTIPVTSDNSSNQQAFDRIRVDFFISNFDLEPQSYLVHSRKFNMPEASYGVFVDKSHVESYSMDDDSLMFKFVVGMKKVEEEPFKLIDNIETFHLGAKELSSTNYPPIIHRWAAEFPIVIHTLVFRVSPENIDKCCYSDQFTAFGAKFSACFNPLGVAKKVKDHEENSSIYLYLCSFDYNDKENELESIKLKIIFANSDFHTESFYVYKSIFESLTSSGSTVQRAYYPPKLIHVDGKPYYEYVMNCCLALMSRKTCHPVNYNPEPEDEDDEYAEEE